MSQVIKIEIPIEVTDNTDPALSNIMGRLNDIDSAAKRVKRSMANAGSSTSGFERSYQKSQRSIKKQTEEKHQTKIEVLDNASPALKKAGSGIKEFTVEMAGMDSAAQKVSRSMATVGTFASKFESSYQKSQESIKEVSKSASGFDKLYQKMRSWGKEKYQAALEIKDKASPIVSKLASWGKKKYQAALEIKDKASPIVNKVMSGVKGFAGKTWSTTVKIVDKVTAPLRSIGRLLTNPLVGFGAMAGVSIGLSDTINTYTTFESTMSRVQALSNANAEQMAQLVSKAKEMGAVTKFSGNESAEAFTYMAQAGWSVNDMISGIGGVMSLAAADGLDLATTTDIVSNALTSFGLKASDSGTFADVLAVASSASNTDVQQLGESFKYVAPVAGAMNYNINDTALALGIMSNNAIKGSMAGTSLKTALANMAAPTDKMSEAMQKYGISLLDGEGNMKSLRGVMNNLRESLGGLSESEQTAAASTIFGKEAMAGMLAIINASEDDWTSLAEQIDNSTGAADRMAETMQDNLAGALEQMGGAVETAQLTLGERLAPYIKDLAGFIESSIPALEDGIIQFMDAFDRRAEAVKEKIAEFTATEEWKNADFFGKVKISWDKLIAEPFSEWWNGSGKESMAEKAMEIGNSIGAGLSTGLLTLLGIDVGTGINEGASIGKNFAQGFISGFNTDSIQTALLGAGKGMFKNAGKIFTGDADLSSWMSAAMIAKIAVPLLGTGMKGIKLGRTIFGSGEGGLGLGSTILDGLKGLGTKLGSGATSGAGLIANGAAATTGAIIGSATLISGGMDLYKGFTSKEKDEADAYKKAGAWKVGGVGAGAAAGAAIGAWFGGIGAVPGALIGAGIGGIAGWFKGNKVKEEYKQTKEEAEEAAAAAELLEEKSKYALKGSHFESESLKDAFEDTSVSAAQFGQMMQEAASQKIIDSFGDIKLSMEEIKEAANQIVFDGKDEQINKWISSVESAESAMSSLQSASSSMEKLNWKASLGMMDNETDIAEYQAGIEAMIASAQQYIEDQHYQATAAVQLLVRPGSPVDMTSGINTMYAEMQEKLDKSSNKLRTKLEVALEDGVITEDEQEIISKLQQKITNITNKISDAQSEAGMQSLKIKYSGASLDADSFANLTAELQTQAQDTADQYQSALNTSLTNLNLQLGEGAINQDQFNAQYDELVKGYQEKMQELAANIESFQLQSIADSKFGDELQGILPDLEGSVAERLGQAMHNAMAAGVDVENWDVQTASEWLGLEGLEASTQSAITEMISQVAATMPEQIASAMTGTESGMGEPFQDMMTQTVENMDFTQFGSTLMSKVGEGLNSVDFSESSSGLSEGLQSSLTASLANVDLSGAAMTLNSKLGEAMATVDMSESGAGIQQGIQTSVMSSVEGLDLSGIGENLALSMSTAAGSMDYSPVSGAVGTGLSNAILNSMGTIQGAISSLYSQVGAAINSAFAGGFSTTTTVRITVNYQLANPSATISFSGGGSGTATVGASIASNADGSIVNGRILSWVGEDGPEAIIPLGSKRRQRGIDLWLQAGRMMGVSEYADGGIIGTAGSGRAWQSGDAAEDDGEADSSMPVQIGNENEGTGGTEIKVDVQLNPTFQVTGSGNDEDVIRIIQSHLKEMADEIGGEIASNLEAIFSNMPLSEGV